MHLDLFILRNLKKIKPPGLIVLSIILISSISFVIFRNTESDYTISIETKQILEKTVRNYLQNIVPKTSPLEFRKLEELCLIETKTNLKSTLINYNQTEELLEYLILDNIKYSKKIQEIITEKLEKNFGIVLNPNEIDSNLEIIETFDPIVSKLTQKLNMLHNNNLKLENKILEMESKSNQYSTRIRGITTSSEQIKKSVASVELILTRIPTVDNLNEKLFQFEKKLKEFEDTIKWLTDYLSPRATAQTQLATSASKLKTWIESQDIKINNCNQYIDDIKHGLSNDQLTNALDVIEQNHLKLNEQINGFANEISIETNSLITLCDDYKDNSQNILEQTSLSQNSDGLINNDFQILIEIKNSINDISTKCEKVQKDIEISQNRLNAINNKVDNLKNEYLDITKNQFFIQNNNRYDQDESGQINDVKPKDRVYNRLENEINNKIKELDSLISKVDQSFLNLFDDNQDTEEQNMENINSLIKEEEKANVLKLLDSIVFFKDVDQTDLKNSKQYKIWKALLNKVFEQLNNELSKYEEHDWLQTKNTIGKKLNEKYSEIILGEESQFISKTELTELISQLVQSEFHNREKELIFKSIKNYQNEKQMPKDISNQVLSQISSSPYKGDSWLARNFGFEKNNPQIVLKERALKRGKCWAFSGNSGQIVIELNQPTIVTKITIGHIIKEKAKSQSLKSAPKHFTVWGYQDQKDVLSSYQIGVLLGTFFYDTNLNTPYQTFQTLNSEWNSQFKVIKFQFLSNYDHDYTCIYRIAIHND
ncbi:klaroid isoform a-related [Anaeramoeba flamelloides]|uniref:Klaroid isoform a-related n=1 Tax=Anaeramoeba flamelloides TaxID=1746091 RepID=A0AAV7YSS5_9EUKA|nr:klaroid isoform a-related [Anaeramoeba flamelloides]